MTNCRHRWEPINFGIKHHTPNHYMYRCARCGNIITTLPKEIQA